MARIDQVYPKKQRRESVIQFGSGVFLRGFFDRMLQKADDAGVMDASAAVVTTDLGAGGALLAQNGQYTHIARGADGVQFRYLGHRMRNAMTCSLPARRYCSTRCPSCASPESAGYPTSSRYEPCADFVDTRKTCQF